MANTTRQKDAIREAFRSAGRPLTPHEAQALAIKAIPKLGIATVYRAVKEMGEAGAGEEYEYVYVVAKRDELQSILDIVRAESNLFNNVSVEAAMPQLIAADQRRGGYRDSTADSKSQAPAGMASPVPSAVGPSAAVALSAAAPPAAKAAKLPETATPTAATPTAATPALTAPTAAAAGAYR